MTHTLARLGRSLGEDLRALRLASPRAGIATRTASSAVLALLAALLLQADDPWWAALTAFAIIDRNARATLSKSLDRVVGTVAGAVVGFLMSAVIADHLTLSLLLGGTVAASLYAQERIEHGYAALLFGVTVVLVVFGSLATPDQSLDLAVNRAIEICVGVAVACLVDYACAGKLPAEARAAARPGLWARPVDTELLANALTGGIGIVAIPFIWEGLQLPGLSQTPITAFVIMTAMRGDVQMKATNRIVGCLLGGTLGLLLLPLVGDAILPWLAAIFTGLFVCAQVRHGAGEGWYAGQQAGVALILAMIQGSAPSTSLIPALDRLCGIVGGVLVITLAERIFAPPLRRLIVALI